MDSMSNLTYITGTGIVYKERYLVVETTGATTGSTLAVYKKLDTENKEETIYNSEYNLSRKAVKSDIVKDYIPSYWQTGKTTSTPVFKKEYMEGISRGETVSADVAITRGGVSAMESHFKLSECNCLEDLENYQNNFFNI